MKKHLVSLILLIPITYYSIISCPRTGNYFCHFVNNEIEIKDILKYKIELVKKSELINGDTVFYSEDRYNEKGDHYYHSYMRYGRYFTERYYYGDSIRIIEKCVNGKCLKQERITALENNSFLYEKLDSSQQVVSWAKQKKWTVKDTSHNSIKYFFSSEYSNRDGENGLIERLSSIDYYNEQNRVIQTDLYSDDTSFYSFYSVYGDDKLIKDSSENSQHNYYYINDTLIESHSFSNELLTSKCYYSRHGKIRETVYFNDTLSVVAKNKSYFNRNGLDSFMLSYFMVDHYFESHTDSSIFWWVENNGDTIFDASLSEHDSLKDDLVPDTLLFEYEYY